MCMKLWHNTEVMKQSTRTRVLQQWDKMKSASSFDITLEQENGTRGRLSASMKQEIKNVQNYGATIKLNPKCARSMSSSIKQNKVRHFM